MALEVLDSSSGKNLHVRRLGKGNKSEGNPKGKIIGIILEGLDLCFSEPGNSKASEALKQMFKRTDIPSSRTAETNNSDETTTVNAFHNLETVIRTPSSVSSSEHAAIVANSALVFITTFLKRPDLEPVLAAYNTIKTTNSNLAEEIRRAVAITGKGIQENFRNNPVSPVKLPVAA